MWLLFSKKAGVWVDIFTCQHFVILIENVSLFTREEFPEVTFVVTWGGGFERVQMLFVKFIKSWHFVHPYKDVHTDSNNFRFWQTTCQSSHFE